MSDTILVSQSILSHEDRTSSNSSPNTGPNTPDDISRWLCHIDLQSFGEGLQAAARAVFPNTSKSRYTKVSALTLCWEDEDPNLPVSIEIEKLEGIFRDIYGFETELWKIPDRNCHARLNQKILDFTTTEDDPTEHLLIVYYAGHAKLTKDRLLCWTSLISQCCGWRNNQNSKFPSVQWSGIQNVLEQAENDVLILLDCCHAGTATTSEGSGVTELISACAYNSRANGVGSYSFTKELAIELRDLSLKPSFTVADLYRNIFCRIQGRQPEDGRERHPAPIHLSLTQDSSQFPRSILLSVQPSLADKQATESLANYSGAERGHLMSQWGQGADRGSGMSSLSDVQQSLGNSTETTQDTPSSSPSAKVPRMLLAIRLKNSFRVGELSPNLFKEWLRNIPAAVEEVKVEAAWDSFSSIIIVSIPMSLSIYLPQDPAIIKIGPITSLNRIPEALRLEKNRVQYHGTTAPKSASRIERVETGKPSASSSPLDTPQAGNIVWKNSQIKMRCCSRCQEQNLICFIENVKTCSACAKSGLRCDFSPKERTSLSTYGELWHVKQDLTGWYKFWTSITGERLSILSGSIILILTAVTFLLVALVNVVLQSLQRYFSTRNITSSKTIRELIWHNRPAVLAIALIAYLVRNRFNRGLNKYPGPFLASLTNWWRFWDVYKRRAEITQMKLHAQCGDVVRLGPNALSFSNPKALKTIYGLNKGFTKSEFYPVQAAVVTGHQLYSLFSTTSELFHAQVRRSVNRAFYMSTLIQYEPAVDSTTELFLSQTEKLFADSGVVCNFPRWLQFYAFDAIGEMTYSKRYGFLKENKDIDGIIDYVTNLFNYSAPIGQIPILDFLFLKNRLYLKALKYGLIDVTFPAVRFAKQCIAERSPKTDSTSILPTKEIRRVSQPDLLSKFIQAKTDHPEFWSDSLVLTMAVSTIFDGGETTAISLSSVFYYLLKNPRCMEVLMKELDDKAREGYFKDNEHGLVTWAESQGLSYLNACITEAFRLHPACGLPLERIVPFQGAEISGEFIKGGTIVGCSPWVIHRRPEVFGKDIEEFRPERWLIDKSQDREGEEKRIREMTSTMLQFGVGARSCIGKNISLLEIYKLVPTVLRRFEVQIEQPDLEWTRHNAWFVRQLNFRTLFKKRDMVQPASL